MLSNPAKHGAALAGVLVLSTVGPACAPPVTRSSVHSTTVGTVRLNERWAPERGVQSVALRRDNQGLALQVQGDRADNTRCPTRASCFARNEGRPPR